MTTPEREPIAVIGTGYVGLVTAGLLGVTFTWVIKAIGWLATPWLRGERRSGGI